MNVITETPSSVLTFLESPLKGFVGARCCSGKKAPSSGSPTPREQLGLATKHHHLTLAEPPGKLAARLGPCDP